MLPSLCVTFLAGLVAGAFLPFFPIAILSVLLAFILILSIAEHCGVLDSPRSLSWCAAVCLGVMYWTGMTPPNSTLMRGDPSAESSVEYSGRIVGLVQHAPSRMTLLVNVGESTSGSVSPKLVRLTWRDAGDAVYAGDLIAFRARLHIPSGSLNPRGFDYASYVERQGIEAVGTVNGPAALHVTASADAVDWQWRAWGQVDRWRGIIRDAAVRSLSQPALGLFLGIVIGERGYVAEEIQEIFMTTGTVHLLSISGSHLGLIAMVVFGALRRGLTACPPGMLLRMTRSITPTRAAILGTWIVVTGYALLAGAELATLRAWIMICMALAAGWIGSDRQLLHGLAAAALLILLHDPRAIGDISFQLSFLSVLAILWAMTAALRQSDPSASVETPWKSWCGRIGEAIALGAAVMLVTTPLVAWYFNQVPWLGLITNLVAVPFTGIILVPLGLLSGVGTLLNLTESLPFASIQQMLLDWMAEALRWCTTLPGSDWRVASPSLWAMTIFYAGVSLAAGAIRFRHHTIVGVGLMILALSGWIWPGRPFHDGDQWRVTFLDVGQGDSALLELPDGKTVLIDGGNRYERFDMGRGVIAPFLLNLGIRRLDHVIATHPQQDHVGGLPWLIRHLEVGEFWHTWIERPEPIFEQLRQTVRERTVTDHVAVRGQHIVQGSPCRLSVLNPGTRRSDEPALQSINGTVLNNESVVTQFVCGRHTIIFAADIETGGLRRLTALGHDPVAVLKVPHHGAKSSLDPEWIARVRPRYAVFSVGLHNSYGHPARDVVEGYRAVGSEIVRTDRDGAIIVEGRVSSPDLHVRRMREVVLRPVVLWDCVLACERNNWHRVLFP